MRRTIKFKIAGAVGAIALAVAAPVALAQSDDSAIPEPGGDTDDLICFEADDPLLGGMGFDEGWLVAEEWPVDGLGEDIHPLPDDLLEVLNREAAELAEHLEVAGIAFEMAEGPMGESWVEWDFEDVAANAAVEEFYGDRDDPFDVFVSSVPFEGGGMLIEGLDFIGFDSFGFGGEICVEAPAAQADLFADEMEVLIEALTEAGVTFTTETIEVQVPVWDPGDDAARTVVEQFYSGMHAGEFEDWVGEVEGVGAGF